MGGGKVAGRTVGRQVESGKRGQDLDLCQIRAPFPDSLCQFQAAWICAIILDGTDPNRSIRTAGTLPGVKGNVSPCLG